MTLIDGVNVFGGYDRAASWNRSAEAQAIIASSAVFDEGGVSFLEGVLARGLVTETIVDRLTVRTPDAPAGRVGVSNHGVRVVASPGLVLRNLVVNAGAASPGSDGSRGAPGANGLDGTNGSGFWFAWRGDAPSPCEGAGYQQKGGAGGLGGRDRNPALPGTGDSAQPLAGYGVEGCGIGGGTAGRNWDNLPLVDVPGVPGGQGASCIFSSAPGAGGLAAVDLASLAVSDLPRHGSGEAGGNGTHGFGGAGGGGGGGWQRPESAL